MKKFLIPMNGISKFTRLFSAGKTQKIISNFLILIISFIVFLAAPLEAAGHSDHGSTLQEILILNSYHPGYAWSDDEQAGIIDVFRAKDKNWLPVIEYLDLKRLPDGRHLAKLKQLFRSKYQNKKFSLVIAMDNPALEFAINNQTELFRNAPIVFCGINNYKSSLLKGHPDVTGIAESIDLAGTIEVMLRLHPATREIFIPHDYTVSNLAVRKEIEALVPRFSAKVRFRFSDPLTMGELLKELERLPRNSLVLEIGFITDKSGRTFGMTEAVMLFFEHSPVPVYSTYEQRLGFGIVGGKLLSARIHGTNAAHIALRVLAGERASAIPVVFESDSQPMFDYKVMNRFGIPLSALPEGSMVINKPVSFYAANRAVIQTAVGIIVFLAVVIFLLTINIIQRRRSTIALGKSEENFRRSMDDSPLGVRVVTIEGETIYTNQAILDTYGYDSIEELKTTPVKKRYTPESYAEFQIRKEKRKRGYDPSEYEISIVRKGGEVRNLQVFRKEVLWNGERQFQVIYQDITEHKRIEKALRESEARFKNLYQESSIPTFTWQKKEDDFILVDFNRASIQLTNGRVADILGNSAGELYRNRPQVLNDMNLCLQGRSVVRREVVSQHFAPGKFISVQYGFIPPDLIIVHAEDRTDRKRVEEELLASREKLRALAGRLQAIREEERTRIAREIHDELGGSLTGLKIDFSLLTRIALQIENETIRTSLLAGMDSMIQSIDAAIHTVRRIAMELRPGILDDLGLVAALEWQLKDFEKRTGIRCEFSPPGEDISIDADLSTALFRIFQEALTNVARHSGATEVRVRLRADADSSTLEVEDNGKGIKKKNTLGKESLGLLGMRERAQMFGGRVTVAGTPGRGTKVTVEISPVEKRKMDRDQGGTAG